MAGIENFAAMLNNMSAGGGGRMAELFGVLTNVGSEAYAQFCNRASPGQSKAFADWISAANSAQVKEAAGRLNSGKPGDPASFVGWLDTLRTREPAPDPEPGKVACPQCERMIKYAGGQAGKKAKCSKCGHVFRIPAHPARANAASSTPQRSSPPADRIPQAAKSELIQGLSSHDFEIQVETMAELRKLKDVSAVPPLIDLLRKHRDSRVREEAAYSLESIGDTRAVEPLIAALMDLDGNVRLKAARALGSLRDLRAVEPLFTSLRDPDQIVRVFAAYALEKLGDKRAVEPLRTALKNSSHEEALRAIQEAITTLSK
jgi:hypothetical protein